MGTLRNVRLQPRNFHLCNFALDVLRAFVVLKTSVPITLQQSTAIREKDSLGMSKFAGSPEEAARFCGVSVLLANWHLVAEENFVLVLTSSNSRRWQKAKRTSRGQRMFVILHGS